MDDEWIDPPTKPGVPPPGVVQDLTGSDDSDPIPTVDESHRIADALDNLALAVRENCTQLHLIAQEIRRTADGHPLPLRDRAAIGNALRGMAIQVRTTADVIHAEGR